MAQTSDSNQNRPPEPGPSADRSTDPDLDTEPDAQEDEIWAPSSFDLSQGLDVAELPELPAEWPGNKPR